jgi:hypothetical protein
MVLRWEDDPAGYMTASAFLVILRLPADFVGVKSARGRSGRLMTGLWISVPNDRAASAEMRLRAMPPDRLNFSHERLARPNLQAIPWPMSLEGRRAIIGIPDGQLRCQANCRTQRVVGGARVTHYQLDRRIDAIGKQDAGSIEQRLDRASHDQPVSAG